MAISGSRVTGTREQWEQVGPVVRKRREFLALTHDDVVTASGRTVSKSVLSNLERGTQLAYRRRGLIAVCRVLRWTDDSIESKLLYGEPAEDLDDSGYAMPPIVSPIERRMAALEEGLAALRDEVAQLRRDPRPGHE